MLYGVVRLVGELITASSVLITFASSFSLMMIERAVCKLNSPRSLRSIALPFLVTMRVVFVFGMRFRIASSISTLSIGLMITMQAFFWLLFASTNSERIVKI